MAAAALGEQLYGRGNDLTDYYYLFFGVGLGGTMVHDGSILRGHWRNAGEFGHVTAVPDGEPCPCGNRGCLERYVSREALQRSGLAGDAWVEAIYPIFCQAVRTIENLFDPRRSSSAVSRRLNCCATSRRRAPTSAIRSRRGATARCRAWSWPMAAQTRC
jgi:predicted NBD/HSP70 family sugar kinase